MIVQQKKSWITITLLNKCCHRDTNDVHVRFDIERTSPLTHTWHSTIPLSIFQFFVSSKKLKKKNFSYNIQLYPMILRSPFPIDLMKNKILNRQFDVDIFVRTRVTILWHCYCTKQLIICQSHINFHANRFKSFEFHRNFLVLNSIIVLIAFFSSPLNFFFQRDNFASQHTGSYYFQ